MRQPIHVPHGSVVISISRSQFFRDPHSADMNVSDSVVICRPAGILVCVFAVQHVQLPGIMECRTSALPLVLFNITLTLTLSLTSVC